MQKISVLFLHLLFLCAGAQFLFSQNEESPPSDAPVSQEAKVTAKDGLIATAETLFSNAVLLTINIINDSFTGNASYAIPTAESIHTNYTNPWAWETGDGFVVNQLGHPLQGSVYYNAGRVNGFGFYESVLFNVLGSYTWEKLCENERASINDFITTVSASMSAGEMLYRLYVDAVNAGIPAPFTFIISPMGGFHLYVTKWKLPDYGRNIYQFTAHAGAVLAQTKATATGLPEGEAELFSFQGPAADAGLAVIYGDPFEQESRTPFEHFELSLSGSVDMGRYMSIRVISDGYLLSFNPVYSDTGTISTGCTLHFDSVVFGKFDNYNSTINQYSNALDWTIKYQHLFSDDMTFQTKFHLGFTFFGSSAYYSPVNKTSNNNFGSGFNSKLFLTLKHRNLGTLEAGVFGYSLYSWPGTSELANGKVYWLFTDLTYSHALFNHLSLGLNYSFALERGIFGNFPNVLKYNNAAKFFVAWNL